MNKKLERYVTPMNRRYRAGLIEFKKRCTDYSTNQKFIGDLFESNTQNITTSLRNGSGLELIDIGCGDGVMTAFLANLILEVTNKNIKVDLLDTAREYLSMTKSKLESISTGHLVVSSHLQKAEHYFALPLFDRYDVIFACHSMHLISLDTIPAMMNSMKPNGYMIVIVGASYSILSILKDMFVPMPAITGGDVLEVINRENINNKFCVTSISSPSYLDLEDIDFVENKFELPDVSKNLFSLMVQKDIDELGQNDYFKARDLMLERLSGSILRLENDCFLINHTQ